MSDNNDHYRGLVENGKRTRFASCGYADRFDPFILNESPYLRKVYGDLFASFLGGLGCGRLLDVGCGTGIYFAALAEHAKTIDAVDTSSEMIDVARDYCEQTGLAHVHPRTGSAESLDYEDGSFDVVMEMDVLHHVTDLPKTLAEVARVLRPGGHFFVFEPNVCSPLMLLAHAIPKEERMALGRNRPGRLRAILSERFETIRWDGVAALITQTAGIKRRALDAYLAGCRLTGIPSLYPRQAWLGRKR
ncbi:MAG: class I SAM-dependent methyltransferase [bacterium]|nr:class I SAM-dependent methyltransferase [bacterium]